MEEEDNDEELDPLVSLSALLRYYSLIHNCHLKNNNRIHVTLIYVVIPSGPRVYGH